MNTLIKEKKNKQEKVHGASNVARHEYWDNRRRHMRIGYWESLARSK